MEEAKRWLRVVGMPVLFLVVGFGLGLLGHRALAPSGRFVATDPTNSGTVLDTKTGQYCIPVSFPTANSSNLPNCLDLYRKY